MAVSRAKAVVKYLNKTARRFKKMIIVETGTIRDTHEDYHIGDGHSTLYIAKWLKGRDHDFFSIDLDTHICRDHLREKKLLEYVNLIQGDSLDILPQFEVIHFAYLDSANDAQQILQEFQIIENKIPLKGMVIVDDVDFQNPEFQKGVQLVPYIKQRGYRFKVSDRSLKIWF